MPRTTHVILGPTPVIPRTLTDPMGLVDSISQSSSGASTFGPVSEPQGDWRPSFGATGYALLSQDNTTGAVQSLPAGVSIARTQGDWFYGGTGDQTERVLLQPTGTERKYGAWYHSTAVIITMTFTNAYSGMVRVYCFDHDSTARRQSIKIDDGSNPAAVALGQFDQGMWVGRSVNVNAGGTVVITATVTAGPNGVVNAIMLDPS